MKPLVYNIQIAFIAFFLISQQGLANSWITDNWEATNTWSEKTEEEYVDYVKEKFNADYFLDRNFWTDCADAVISLRNIFAYEKNLPMYYGKRSDTRSMNLLKSGTKSQVKRFFIDIRNGVSTRTIMYTSYPVKHHKDSLTPGSFYLYPAFHAQIVHSVETNGMVNLLESTIPAKVRTLKAITFNDNQIYLYHPEFSFTRKDGGFRKLKRPNSSNSKLEYNKDHEISSANLDSIINGSRSYRDVVAEGLAKSFGQQVLSSEELLDISFNNTKILISDRVNIVCAGYEICKNKRSTTSGDCDRGLNGAHSTPGRDSKIVNSLNGMLDLFRTLGINNQAVRNHIAKLKNTDVNNLLCDGSGSMSLYQSSYRFMSLETSSDPIDRPYKRWGDNDFNTNIDDAWEHYFN